MWWTLAVSVALALDLALGAFLLWSGGHRRLAVAWALSMLAVAGWYTTGAYRLAEGLSSLGEGMRALGAPPGASTGAAPRDTTSASSPPSDPPPAPSATFPARWEAFPAQADAPVRVEVTEVSPARFTGIDVRVRLTNERTDATVDGVRFDVWCFDNFGDVIRAPALRDHPGFGMVDQQTITPGQRATGTWSLRFGADTCTRARAWVRQVHFTDGTQWQGAEQPTATP